MSAVTTEAKTTHKAAECAEVTRYYGCMHCVDTNGSFVSACWLTVVLLQPPFSRSTVNQQAEAKAPDPQLW
jgi:hypothetical protein